MRIRAQGGCVTTPHGVRAARPHGAVVTPCGAGAVKRLYAVVWSAR